MDGFEEDVREHGAALYFRRRRLAVGWRATIIVCAVIVGGASAIGAALS